MKCGTSSSSWYCFPTFLTNVLGPECGGELVIGVAVCLTFNYEIYRSTGLISEHSLAIFLRDDKCHCSMSEARMTVPGDPEN